MLSSKNFLWYVASYFLMDKLNNSLRPQSSTSDLLAFRPHEIFYSLQLPARGALFEPPNMISDKVSEMSLRKSEEDGNMDDFKPVLAFRACNENYARFISSLCEFVGRSL